MLSITVEVKAGRETGVGAGILFHCPATGNYLLVKRSEYCDEPHTWATLGGGVEAGETLEEAARREAREEAGFDEPVTLKPLGSITYEGGFVFHTFLAHVETQFEPTLNHEHVDHVWTDDFTMPDLHPGFGQMLDQINQAGL